MLLPTSISFSLSDRDGFELRESLYKLERMSNEARSRWYETGEYEDFRRAADIDRVREDVERAMSECE